MPKEKFSPALGCSIVSGIVSLTVAKIIDIVFYDLINEYSQYFIISIVAFIGCFTIGLVVCVLKKVPFKKTILIVTTILSVVFFLISCSLFPKDVFHYVEIANQEVSDDSLKDNYEYLAKINGSKICIELTGRNNGGLKFEIERIRNNIDYKKIKFEGLSDAYIEGSRYYYIKKGQFFSNEEVIENDKIKINFLNDTGFAGKCKFRIKLIKGRG